MQKNNIILFFQQKGGNKLEDVLSYKKNGLRSEGGKRGVKTPAQCIFTKIDTTPTSKKFGI
jgi:hypothetical protein